MKTINALYVTTLGLMDNLAVTQILSYLEGLSEKRIKINILSFEKKHNLKNRILVEKLERRLLNLDIKWNRLVFQKRWGNLINILMGFIKSWQIVKKRHISIIHARALIPIFIAWPLAKILKIKLIFDRRDTIKGYLVDNVNKKNIFSISIFSKMLEALEKFMIRNSNATIVLSEKVLRILREDSYFNRGKNIFEAIPCCTDLNRFNKNISKNIINKIDLSKRFVMTYLGSLGTCYLLEEMIGFYKVLKRKKENAFFFIISNIEKEYVENVLKKENLFPGHDYMIINVKPEEVPVYLGMSDCSIMFIKSSGSKIGSSPTKFGESLAAGVPVIINEGIGDTEDIILSQKVGILIDSFNESAYERAIDNLFSLLSEKAILRERCIKTANDFFSLSMGINRYTEVYEKLAKFIEN